jgi:small nuclear ribonucleoprotein (snRNP)-like protein
MAVIEIPKQASFIKDKLNNQLSVIQANKHCLTGALQSRQKLPKET